MGCKKGATGLCVFEEPGKEKEKRQQDFTVKIVFSSMSYTTYTNWMKMRIGDKSKPHTSSAPVELEVWPRSDAYEPNRDELIFIDCSSQKAKNMLPDADDFNGLAVKLSWAINRLKELMYRRTKQGIYGTVKCCLMGITPCEMLTFALSRLLGNSTEHDDKFAPFISYVLSRPEFRYAFQWIQEYGWMFEVDYCGVFEPYKSILNDFQGSADRAEEMEKVLTKPSKFDYKGDAMIDAMYNPSHDESTYNTYEAYIDHWISAKSKERRRNPETGNVEVLYNNHWTDYDELEQAHEDLVNPSEEQLNESLKQAKENRKRINNNKNTLSSQIDREQKNRIDGTWDEIIENDVSRLTRPINVAEGTNKGYGEIKDRLINEGFVPTQEHYDDDVAMGIQVLGSDSRTFFYKTKGERNDKKLIFIQGQWMTNEQAAALESKMQEELDAADKAIQDINKALLAKKYFLVGLVLDAIQFVNGIASIFCPALAFLDIAIQAFRWEFDPTCEVNALGVAGMVCDVASLVPYFGTIYRTLKAGSKLVTATTHISESTLKAIDNIDNVADLGQAANKLTDAKKIAGAADDSSSMVKVVDNNPNAMMEYNINGEVVGNVGESSRLLTSDVTGSSMLAEGATDAAKTGSKGAKAADNIADVAEEGVSVVPPFEGEIVGVGKTNRAATDSRKALKGKTAQQSDKQLNNRIDSFNDNDMIVLQIKKPNGDFAYKPMTAKDAKEAMKTNGRQASKTKSKPKKETSPDQQPETTAPPKKDATPDQQLETTAPQKTDATPAQQPEATSNTNSSHSQQTELEASGNKNSGQGDSMTTSKDISSDAVQGQIDATGATTEAAGGNPSNKGLHINRFNEFCSEFKDRWKFYFSKEEASLTNMKNEGLFFSSPKQAWEGFMSGWKPDAHWEQRLGSLMTSGTGVLIGFNGFALVMKMAGQGKPDEKPDKYTTEGEVKEFKPTPIDFRAEADKADQDLERAKQMQQSKDPAEVAAGRQLERDATRRKGMAEDGIQAKQDEELYHTYRPTDEDVEASKQRMIGAQNEERAAQSYYDKWSTTTPQAELDNNHFNSLQERQQLELMATKDKYAPGQTQRDAKANLDSKSSNAREMEQEYLDQKFLQYTDFVAQATSKSKETELSNEIFVQQHQNDNADNNNKK